MFTRIGTIFTILLLSACTAVPEGVTPVQNFEQDRYLGKWYEIARLDHSFERGLNNVTAEYSLREDGGIRVINRGFNSEDNSWKEAEGKAYFVADNQTGHLKVSFFGPFYASYVIAALDDKYQSALVTGPDTDYLWILARTPSLAQTRIDELLAIAKEAGFAVDTLIFVQHGKADAKQYDEDSVTSVK